MNNDDEYRTLLKGQVVEPYSVTRFDVRVEGTGCRLFVGTVNSDKKVLWSPYIMPENGEPVKVYYIWGPNVVTWTQGKESQSRDTQSVRSR